MVERIPLYDRRPDCSCDVSHGERGILYLPAKMEKRGACLILAREGPVDLTDSPLVFHPEGASTGQETCKKKTDSSSIGNETNNPNGYRHSLLS